MTLLIAADAARVGCGVVVLAVAASVAVLLAAWRLTAWIGGAG